jgi:hypothetical protein
VGALEHGLHRDPAGELAQLRVGNLAPDAGEVFGYRPPVEQAFLDLVVMGQGFLGVRQGRALRRGRGVGLEGAGVDRLGAVRRGL